MFVGDSQEDAIIHRHGASEERGGIPARDGHVFAVEPNPIVFATLCAHVASNRISQVRVSNWGLSDTSGSIAIHVPDAESFRDYNATMLERPCWTAIEMPVRRLDDCIAEWQLERIDLMKIDVEGWEPRVLAGGAASLSNGVVRHLMIEINGPRLVEAGSSPAALVASLADLGFVPARLSHGRVVPIAVVDVNVDPAHEHDRLFVHDTDFAAKGGAS